MFILPQLTDKQMLSSMLGNLCKDTYDSGRAKPHAPDPGPRACGTSCVLHVHQSIRARVYPCGHDKVPDTEDSMSSALGDLRS